MMEKIVATSENMGTALLIARDTGWFEGTRPEYNIRKIETLHRLENVSITNPVFRAIADRGEGYGGRWGASGILFPLSQQDIEALVAEQQNQELFQKKREAEEKRREKRWQARVGKYLCPRCATFCHGDCEPG